MGIVNYTYNRSTSGGEIIRELINSTDGQGLHFDGAAGSIDIPTVPDLGTKFSLEFIIQADSWGDSKYVCDFGTGGRFSFAAWTDTSYNLAVYDNGFRSFGVKILDDLKVHHLVMTVDGTAAKIYDNGNQVGTATLGQTPNIDNCTDAAIGSYINGTTDNFDGTIYRARLWNKTLSSTEVTDAYENATVPFADQYGSQTDLVAGWSNSTYATFNHSGLTITSVISASGTVTAKSNATYTQTAGKRYQFRYNLTLNSGEAPTLVYGSTSDTGGGSPDGSAVLVAGANVLEFTASTTGSSMYLVYKNTAATNWSLADVELVAAGCAVDLDLAFANPSPSPNGQSLQIQDRSTNNVKGTASATGVTQVTPIEQLNAKAARIGTSAATPADGELLVSGDVLIGDGSADIVGYNRALTVATHTAGQVSAIELVSHQNADADLSGVEFINDTTRVAAVYASRSGADNSGKLTLATANAGTVAARLTIDSAGNVGIGTSPVNNLTVRTTGDAADDAAQSTFALMLQKSLDDLGQEIGLGFRSSTTQGAANVPGGAITFERTATQSVGSLHFKTAPSEDQLDTRLTIDSAGKATFSPTGNVMAIYSSPAVTTDSAIKIQADSLTTGRAAYFTSNASGTENRELVWIRNDNAAATGTTCLKVTNDSTGRAITAIGGIVEEGGVLKENLLTNSGFDVWSNSTLETVATIKEDDCASDDTGDWTQTRTALAFVTDHYTYTPSGTHNEAYISSLASLTAGKLYEISVDVKNGAGSTTTLQLKLYDGTAILSPTITTTGSFVTHTFVAEATATTANGAAVIMDATHFASNIQFKNFSLKEVTPGCVAADDKAMDGWKKDSTLDIWRQHNDGGTLTKDGSFYSLKTTTTATNDYFLWPPSYSGADHYQRFAGRTVTFGCWVKSSDASHVRLKINDGTETFSDYHTGGGAWEWLEVTKTIASTPTNFYVQALLSLAAKTAYFSQPMLVFGSAIGEGNYTRPQGEIVWFENRVMSNALNATGFSDVAFTTLNTEADSNGAIPKGAKAVFMFGETGDSSSSTSDTFMRFQADATADRLVYASCAGLANDRFGRETTWQPCDSSGDFQYQLEASGSGTLDAYLNYNGVQLR
jgi:hypothetical protein